jgi:hypothetical protein
MLSDHERKTLLDVERRFMAEDPEYARSFDDQLHLQLAAPSGSNGKIAVAVALLFSAILLLAGFPGGALACVITTAVNCAMWWCLEDSEHPASARSALTRPPQPAAAADDRRRTAISQNGRQRRTT